MKKRNVKLIRFLLKIKISLKMRITQSIHFKTKKMKKN